MAPRIRRGWSILAGLLGAALVLVATSTSGPGVSPDSAAYLSAAESVAAGRGYVRFDDDVYASWPPLYPSVLAPGILLGFDRLAVARVVNAIVFALIVVVSTSLFSRYLRSPWLVAAGAAAVLLSTPLLSVSIMVWSEPLFTLLLVLMTLSLRRFELEGRHRDLLIAAGVAGLACLQRYAGVLVVAAGMALLLLGHDRHPALAARLKQALILAVVALAPVTVWVIRNLLMTGSPMLPLAPLGLTMAETLRLGADVLTSWVVPPRWRLATRIVAVFAVMATGGLLARAAGRGAAPDGEDWKARLRDPLVFAATYGGSMFAIILTLHYEVHRLLTPLYVWLAVAALIALEELIRRLGRAGRWGTLVSRLVAIASVMWLAYQGSRVVRDVSLYIEQGAGSYRWDWQGSAILDWVRTTTVGGTMYSNAPDAMYLLAGKRARYGPMHAEDLSTFARRTSPAPRYFVWFDRAPTSAVLKPDELARVVTLTPLVRLDDGAVFRLDSLPGADTSMRPRVR